MDIADKIRKIETVIASELPQMQEVAAP